MLYAVHERNETSKPFQNRVAADNPQSLKPAR